MRAFFRVVLLALVLVSVALVSALTAMRYAIHGREVSVPKLVGMTPSQAEAAAQQNGLLLSVDGRYYSADVPPGRVMSQSPAPGVAVRRGWRVRVAESLGPQRVSVPNITGQSLRAAEINLGRRGLEPGGIAIASLPGLASDQVVAQDPPANAENVTSPRVDLLVTAPEDERSQAYVMPEFVGKTLAEAKVAIEDSGFKLGKVSLANGAANGKRAAKPAASDLIVKQNPAAGQKIIAGATIALEVTKP